MCPYPLLLISQTCDVWTVLLLWADLKPTSARFKESPDTLFILAERSFIPAAHAASVLLPEGWAFVYRDTERTSNTNVVLHLCASGCAPVPIQSGILCVIWFFWSDPIMLPSFQSRQLLWFRARKQKATRASLSISWWSWNFYVFFSLWINCLFAALSLMLKLI